MIFVADCTTSLEGQSRRDAVWYVCVYARTVHFPRYCHYFQLLIVCSYYFFWQNFMTFLNHGIHTDGSVLQYFMGLFVRLHFLYRMRFLHCSSYPPCVIFVTFDIVQCMCVPGVDVFTFTGHPSFFAFCVRISAVYTICFIL